MAPVALMVGVFALLLPTTWLAAGQEQCSNVKLCPGGLCCSKWGFCGSTADYCGAGCQSGPCNSQCSATVPCANNQCCNRFGTCGSTPSDCGPGCQSGPCYKVDCGKDAGGLTCANNNCCSQWGFCGNTTEHCGIGCQSGACSYRAQCGANAGGAICPGNQCCSANGTCGTTASHCAYGCQSGPCFSETCGRNAGGALCPNGICCSQWGFCGSTTEHCGTGCQSGPCLAAQCGANAGGKMCPQGQCCSVNGTCGTTASHCAYGCQSGPCFSEQCGRNAGGALCPSGLCCSEYGFCGTTWGHCSPARLCQSNCWKLLPTQPAPPRLPPPSGPTPPPPKVTYGFDGSVTLVPRYLNRNVFRYANLNYSPSRTNWALNTTADWSSANNRLGRPLNLPVKDQDACSACWAMAAATAVSAALLIANPQLLPASSGVVQLSAQQVLSCNGRFQCSGGLPSAALDYIADKSPPLVSTGSVGARGLYMDASYPYIASNASCKMPPCATCTPMAYGITMFEQANFLGWVGLLLTVQQQPAIVTLYADCFNFLTYTGGVFMDASCDGAPNHAVVVVGYSMSADTPYWIIHNSWGTRWGEGGRMRMAVAGGYGLCNIHLSPPLYPIVASSNPCTGAYNPCGTGQCIPTGERSNRCNCVDPFVSVTNIDKLTQTCVPRSACSFFLFNPCSVGTCVDDGRGGYSCVCPPGFVAGVLATDNSSTCVPDVQLTRQTFFTVESSTVTCDAVASAFGLSTSQLAAQNGQLCRTAFIPPKTRVNVTRPQGLATCSAFYTWTSDDTCSGVANLFGFRITNLTSLNPWLNCAATTPAQPGMQVCLQAGATAPTLPLCTAYYTTMPGDTCDTIRAANRLDALTFYRLNPGILCDRWQPGSVTTYGEQVCISESLVSQRVCPRGSRAYPIAQSDTCTGLLIRFFKSLKRMADLNPGWRCVRPLYKTRVVCVPDVATSRPPPPISKSGARKQPARSKTAARRH